MDIKDQIEVLVFDGNVEEVRKLLTARPDLINAYYSLATLLHFAAGGADMSMVEMLVELGSDVNALKETSTKQSVLDSAIRGGNLDIIRMLLDLGASPDVGRPVIGAIIGDKENSLAIVKLLEEYGADIHKVFMHHGFGELINALSTAISWEKTDVVEYLRSRNAVLPEQDESRPITKTLRDEIIDFFEEDFGPVKQQSLIEIVPSSIPPIDIHVVPSSDERNHITLFTTGMSSQPMTLPADGDTDYQFAEMFLQLPGDWPLDIDSISDPSIGWPVHWMRSIAQFPHQNATWLGGPVTIFANDDPPQPIAPYSEFTSFLLLAERELEDSKGKMIQFYRMLPLYTDEREFEIKHGIGALLRAFDQQSVPFVIDLNRNSVAHK